MSFQTGIPPADWDETLAKHGGHVLQSRGWAEFQQALGKEIVYASGDGWCWMGYLERRRGGQFLYTPYGPVAKSESALRQAIQNLKSGAGDLRVDFVRLEPVGAATPAGLRAWGGRLVDENQPRRTIVMNLADSVDELKHGLAQSNRNLINTAEARGVRLERAESAEATGPFMDLVAQTVRHQKIHLYDERYFKTLFETLMPLGMVQLHYATYQGRHAASAVTLDFADTRYYLFAASDFELNREAKAAVPLLWSLIMDAKEAGLGQFDFYGIAPTDDPNDKKAGITRFKRSFCDNVVTRVGTWEIPVRTMKYHLYAVAKRAMSK
ncbi:MAG TPA: peptidoglycan bridge formation glycyltransferase FemA/FemB family protein [Candidatus Saccharimonadia bacterium]|jgi:lipid II:glycine glycyltransferase (peptidoglycan interpeptide bridge formation enzyme)